MKTDSTSLLGAGRLGRYELPTRMIMAPMTGMRAHADGAPSDMMATYYSQRASTALVITEATHVDVRRAPERTSGANCCARRCLRWPIHA